MDRALSFPFRIADRGVADVSGHAAAVAQQLRTLLLTIPGERVNRPDFGCGIQRLAFAGAGPEAAAAAEYVIATSIRRHLGDLVQLDAVRVTVDDTDLHVDVLYTLLGTREELAATFTEPLQVPR